jgi:hypothetical protein
MDGIYPALLQQGREIAIPYLIRIFRACLAMGYVPATRRQVKVVFIPKPGRNSYTGPRDFRPISLTSFLLKTMEWLVDKIYKGWSFDSYAIAYQPACLPISEIFGNDHSSARGVGEGAGPAGIGIGCFPGHRRSI